MSNPRDVELNIIANDKTGRATRSASGNFDRLGKDVDRSVRKIKANVGSLEKDTSSDLAKFGESMVSRFTEIGLGIGDTLTGGISSAISAFGPVVQTALAAVFIVAAAAAGTFIAAALMGAVLAAISGGVLAAGIMLAMRNAQVKSAFDPLITKVKDALLSASQVFVVPLQNAARILSSAFDKVMPNIRAMFAQTAPFVEQFANAIVGLVMNAMPGFMRAFQASLPFLNELINKLPAIGTALGRVFTAFSVVGPEAMMGFKLALDFTVRAIEVLGTSLAAGAYLFGVLVKAIAGVVHALAVMTAPIPGVGAAFASADKSMQGFIRSSYAATDTSKGLRGGVDSATKSIQGMSAAADSMPKNIMVKFASDGLDALQSGLNRLKSLISSIPSHIGFSASFNGAGFGSAAFAGMPGSGAGFGTGSATPVQPIVNPVFENTTNVYMDGQVIDSRVSRNVSREISRAASRARFGRR